MAVGYGVGGGGGGGGDGVGGFLNLKWIFWYVPDLGPWM